MIEIPAHIISDTILIPLLDRSSELKELVEKHKPFFYTLKNYLGQEWFQFEIIFYSDRSFVSDLDWINKMKEYLGNCPSLLETLKELVGYDFIEEKKEERNFDDFNISIIRSKLFKITPTSYPQFFLNCKREMEDPDSFLTTLFSKPIELNDISWELKIINQTRCYPTLFDQLKEIIEYEIED